MGAWKLYLAVIAGVFIGWSVLRKKGITRLAKVSRVEVLGGEAVLNYQVVDGAVDSQADALRVSRRVNPDAIRINIDSPAVADPRVVFAAFTKLLQGVPDGQNVQQDHARIALGFEAVDLDVASGHIAQDPAPSSVDVANESSGGGAV